MTAVSLNILADANNRASSPPVLTQMEIPVLRNAEKSILYPHSAPLEAEKVDSGERREIPEVGHTEDIEMVRLLAKVPKCCDRNQYRFV